MASVIHLEGTTLEGGGQLLRIALALSSLTKIPLHISNIRGKRSGGGGLKAQHLTSVQWLGKACNAHLRGACLKSKELVFTPCSLPSHLNANEPDWENEVFIKQNTPGSVNLVLQAILPYLLFSKRGHDGSVRLHITGGTNVSNSPSCDYIEQVLLPMLELIGIPPIAMQLHSRGWSQGGPTKLGSVTYTITPLNNNSAAMRSLPAFSLNHRGRIKQLRATAIAPAHCEQHFRNALHASFDALKQSHPHVLLPGEQDDSPISLTTRETEQPDIEMHISFEDSHHEKRFYLLLVATSTTGIKLGRDWLYDRGSRAVKAEIIVGKLVEKVFGDLVGEMEHGGCVDGYARDQLVVYQGLARGRSFVDGGRRGGELVEPSLHTETARWVVGEMTGVEFDAEGGCEGLGFEVEEGAGEEAERYEEGVADVQSLVGQMGNLDVSTPADEKKKVDLTFV